MADGTPTANYGWIKPSVGASDDLWGGELNTDLDGIDSVVHGIQTSKYDAANPAGYQTAGQVAASLAPYALASAVPAASNTTPLVDGTASAGASAAWSRGDHVHPTDTSRYAASNPNGYVTAAGAASAAPVQSVAGRTGAVTITHADITDWTTTLAPYALTTSVPAASAATPLVNGTAAVGTDPGFSRGDHRHPTDTTRAPLTGPVFQGSVLARATTGDTYFGIQNGSGVNQGALYWNATTGFTSMINFNNSATATLNAGGNFVVTSGALKPGGGSWADSSDARIKTVQGDYDKGLDEILDLHPVVYTFMGNDTDTADVNASVVGRTDLQASEAPYPASPHYQLALDQTPFVGFIAQELEQIFPGMVNQRDGFIDGEEVTDLRNVDTSNLVYALVNAVKTLAARVTELEAKNG